MLQSCGGDKPATEHANEGRGTKRKERGGGGCVEKGKAQGKSAVPLLSSTRKIVRNLWGGLLLRNVV